MNQRLKNKLDSIIKEVFDTSITVEILNTPDKKLGDKATNAAMTLAKLLKKNPMEIAEIIKEKLSEETYIEKIEIAQPGFINIFFNETEYLNDILKKAMKDDFVHVKMGEGEKLIIEHTAANPNKHLHIGHLRNFCIGDSLARLMSKTDYEIEVQFFNNDLGLQIAKILWGLKNLKLIGADEYDEKMKFDVYAGKVYPLAEKYLTEHPETEPQIREMIQTMEEGNNSESEFGKEITRKILKGQLQTVFNFDVHYDDIISESTLTQSGLLKKTIDKLLEEKKIVKEKSGKNEGCIVIKNLKDEAGNPIPDKVLIRSDGTAVYTAKDITLFIWKFNLMGYQLGFEKFVEQNNGKWIYISTTDSNNEHPQFGHGDRHINVVDVRQSFPLEVVKQSLGVLGFLRASENYKHLAYEFVNLSKATAEMLGVDTTDGKGTYAMSGRKGIEISIDNILEKMKAAVQSKKPELGTDESQKIAAGALRYYMLKYGYNNVITFDVDEALKSDGDTGIYLQYTYVRAKSILKKADYKGIDAKIPGEIQPEEKYLAYKLNELNEVVARSVEDLDLQRICVYGFELCKVFSNFYQAVSVLNEADEEKKNFRLYLITVFEKVLGDLFDILGMYKAERM